MFGVSSQVMWAKSLTCHFGIPEDSISTTIKSDHPKMDVKFFWGGARKWHSG